MPYKKKCFDCAANSILESVIALSLISICLFVALLVYTNVFSMRTSSPFYNSKNKVDETFFLLQVHEDSINEEVQTIEEEELNAYLKKVMIKPKDSLLYNQSSIYYIQINE